MIESTCHCGAVKLEILAAPETLTDCNCSICRRYGGLWAHYSPKDVRVVARQGAVDGYTWGDKLIAFHRCHDCGCITHWSAVDPSTDRMGVNARMMAPEVLAIARVRRLDGASTWKYLDE
jgi:hypothetical protein